MDTYIMMYPEGQVLRGMLISVGAAEAQQSTYQHKSLTLFSSRSVQSSISSTTQVASDLHKL